MLYYEPASADRAYFGLETVEEGAGLRVRTVTAGTPAYEQGLNTGDVIVAIDGYRATQSFLQSYLGERKVGDKVKLTFFRYDKLREFEITAAADNRKGYSIIPLEAATEAQRNLLKQYLNVDLN
jgi:predicted metalloprotease with PDZ domain